MRPSFTLRADEQQHHMDRLIVQRLKVQTFTDHSQGSDQGFNLRSPRVGNSQAAANTGAALLFALQHRSEHGGGVRNQTPSCQATHQIGEQRLLFGSVAQ